MYYGTCWASGRSAVQSAYEELGQVYSRATITSGWETKRAQWPVPGTLRDVMVSMTCIMGMWILSIGQVKEHLQQCCFLE